MKSKDIFVREFKRESPLPKNYVDQLLSIMGIVDSTKQVEKIRVILTIEKEKR